MKIGERIREHRLACGLSVDDLAKKLNINRATVYRYESSVIEKLPVTVLKPLAKVLKTTPAVLMGWEEEPNTLTVQERELLDMYQKAKTSNKKMVDSLVKAIYKLLEITE